MAVFKSYPFRHALPGPWIARNKMHFAKVQRPPILLFGAIPLTYIHHVVVNIFLYHIPRASAKAQSFALTYGMKPESIVLANLTACFQLYNGTFSCTKMALYKIVVIYLSQKTDALRVLT
jgi:hypothetical protein